MYEIEGIIHQETTKVSSHSSVGTSALSALTKISPLKNNARYKSKASVDWQNLEIILDSPMAGKFTHAVSQLKHCWNKEAQRKIKWGRKPLSFENLTTINTHE